MTAGGVGRPFASRVARQGWAQAAVTPMIDVAGLRKQRSDDEVPDEAYAEQPPALYVYRMRDGTGDHTGVVADVRLDAFADGSVRGHEGVDENRVAALVRYYAAEPARTEPVALLHEQQPAATRSVARACRQPPLLAFRGSNGEEHAVWRVPAEHEAEIAADLGHGLHYVADGHHRVAARRLAWEEAGRPPGAGVLCVVFPMTGLTLSAFHRRVTGPVDAPALLAAAADHFDVRPLSDGDRPAGIGVYAGGRWYDAEPAEPRADGSAGLDAALLQAHLLGPALGIEVPDDPRLEMVPDRVSLEELAASCDADGGVLFALRPPPLAALTRIADLGERMPAKTTYFSPKPYAGIFLT